MPFWRRNRAFFKLAVVSNLEYRINYLTDAIFQPLAAALIEICLWYSIFKVSGVTEIMGFSLDYYLAYILWATFVGRISTNWMYEFRMIEEIETGSINGLLSRPFSFFEYYLAQFFGYKVVTTAVSMIVPFLAISFFKLPTDWSRAPLAFALVLYYLIFVHLLSFFICTFAFHLTKVSAITTAKNLGLWLLSGELLPLDIMPEPFRSAFISLPFANAVFIPVGYLTGRFELDVLWKGFFSCTVGILILMPACWIFWKRSLQTYVGTGA